MRRLREDRGLSQEALAKASGLSRSTVVAVELGKYGSTDSSTVDALARGLRVPAAALVTPAPRSESLAPAVAAFLGSPWREAMHPTEAEIAWLAALPDIVYSGTSPTAETVAELLRWKRQHQQEESP